MYDIQSVSTAILVGGMGTRLRSAVSDRPKPLAEIHGRPFLAYLLDQLAVAGVRDVVMCSGYRANQVEAAFGNQYRSLILRYSRETEPLGTAGALRKALPFLTSDTVLVLNGDSMCECDLQGFWGSHVTHQGRISLVLTWIDDISRYGQVRMDDKGCITQFLEKDATRTGPGWINAGIYLLPRRVIAEIPEGKAASLERDIFPSWTGDGLSGYQSTGRFIDIGTPESYQAASQFFVPGDPS